MKNQSSQAALASAAARAAHLIVDRAPHIFADTLAVRLLGELGDQLLAYQRDHGGHPALAGARAQAVIRAQVTEEHLAAAVASGVDQYVILGAGLDSFAYRSPLATEVHVFEVDHPATQSLKRERLSALGATPTDRVSYVPIDFEIDPLVTSLTAGGFDLARPALASWLGVSMYLTSDAIGTTLDELGTLAPGTQIVMDYLLPAELRDAAGQMYADMVGPTTAERGEPWLSFLTPQEVGDLLAARGFHDVRSVGQRDALPDELWRRDDALQPAALSMIAHAVRRP
ncbi:class I SAM-dependent methyltransferase [Micromonospora okii]|uniref:class I SAM-dependent methyltransferase n=1 Tax=Micromonospora okii TaxID=1182970 RepID=UPI001E46A0C0|nr:SAM-dependent methyltransferase [Micromonospora okii]